MRISARGYETRHCLAQLRYISQLEALQKPVNVGGDKFASRRDQSQDREKMRRCSDGREEEP